MENTSNGFRIRTDTAAVFGYVHSRAGIPLIESVTVEAPEDIRDRAELKIDFAPEIFRPAVLRLGRLSAGSRVVSPRLGEPVVSALLGSTAKNVKIVFTLSAGGKVLASCEKLVPLAAFDSVSPASVYPSLAAAFVLPDCASVKAVADNVREGVPAAKFYFRTPVSHVAAKVEEVYEQMKKCGVAYSVRQYSAEKTTEHLRPAPVCLRAKNGDSLELALLFASVCEALGLDVCLLFFASSVMAAVRRRPSYAAASEDHDAAALIAAVTSGDLIAVDPTGFCYGTDIPFSVSRDRALKALSSESLIAAVNVRAARREGVLPLPAELCGNDAALDEREILTAVQEPEKESVRDALYADLAEQKGFADLTDTDPAYSIPADALTESTQGLKGILSGAAFELAAASALARPCLCAGEVKYFDPVAEKTCLAPVVVMPLVRRSETEFSARGAVCNSALFEKLAGLYGFDHNGALAAFAEGAEALLDFVGTAASMSDSFEFDGRVFAASLRAELAASHAALRRFSLPSGGAEIPVGAGRSFDSSFNRALTAALSGGFTAVRSGDPSVREDLALAAAANALHAGHRVLVVSGDPALFTEKLRALSSRGAEVKGGGFDGKSLEEIFCERPQGFSFYNALCLADKYRGAAKPVDLPTVLFEGLTERGAVRWSETVSALTDAMEKTGGIPKNPLRYVASPSFSPGILENASMSAARCTGALQSFMASLSDAASLLQVTDCSAKESKDRLLAALGVLAHGERIPHYYFENRLPDTVEVVRTMKNHWTLKKELEKTFSKDVFTLDVLSLKSSLRSAALLGGRKKKVLEKSVCDDLRGCALVPIDAASVPKILDDLDRVREYSDYTVKNSGHLRSCLGVDVTSPDTDKDGLWDRLERICLDADRFESAYLELSGSDPAAVPSVLRTPDLPGRAAAAAQRIQEEYARLSAEYDSLKHLLGLEIEKSGCPDLGAELAVLSDLRDGMDGLGNWTAWLKIRLEAISLGLGDAVKQCESGAFSAEQIKENFLCGFFNSLCAHIVSSSPELSGFDAAKQADLMRTTFENEKAALGAAASDLSGLVSLGLTQALCADGVYSLAIVTDAHLIPACVGAGLLGKAPSVITVGDPLSDGGYECLSDLALRSGASDRVISGFVSSSPAAADAACRFAEDVSGARQFAVYPSSGRFGVRIISVKGGYDDASETNVIEAKVIVDELEDCVRSGVKSVGIVTFGAAQKTLVARMLAGKLSGDPFLREKLIGGGASFFISSFDEDPGEADVILLSTCFTSPVSGYAKGLSPKLFALLGPNCACRLSRLFTLAKRFLTVVCSFGFEELSNTCSTLGGASQFRKFCARLFALENSPASADPFPARPHEPMISRLAEDLRARGWLVRADCGFGQLRTDLLISDPFDPIRRFAVLSDAALKEGVDGVFAGSLIAAFASRGTPVFRLCFADRFSDPEKVVSSLNAFIGSDPGEDAPFEDEEPAL